MKIITIKSIEEVRTETFVSTLSKIFREEVDFWEQVDKAINDVPVTIYDKTYSASTILKLLDPEAYQKTASDIVRDKIEYIQYYFLDGDGTEVEWDDTVKVVLKES